MQNSSIDILISRLLSNNITDDERKVLDEWLSESPDNKKYLGQLINIWQSSHPAFDPEEIQMESAIRDIHHKIEAAGSLSQGKSFKILVWWQRIAAVLFIPVIVLMAIC